MVRSLSRDKPCAETRYQTLDYPYNKRTCPSGGTSVSYFIPTKSIITFVIWQETQRTARHIAHHRCRQRRCHPHSRHPLHKERGHARGHVAAFRSRGGYARATKFASQRLSLRPHWSGNHGSSARTS